jgi:hypothetical protein
VNTNNYDRLNELHNPKVPITTAHINSLSYQLLTYHNCNSELTQLTQVSKSKLCYDRRSVSRSALVSRTHLGPKTRFCYCQTVACFLKWGALYDERTGLLFTFTAGPRQRSHFRVTVPRGSRPQFTVSDSRLPNLEGQVPHNYIPQEQGGPVISPGTWLPFHRLLQLAGIRWRYSTPLLHGENTICPRYITPLRTAQKSLFHYCVSSRCRGNVFPELFPSNGFVLSPVYPAVIW